MKRGEDPVQVTLSDLADTPKAVGAEELSAALDALARRDERQAHIVELRFFGGLTVEEVADVLGVSAGTVKRDWTLARAWLHRELTEEA